MGYSNAILGRGASKAVRLRSVFLYGLEIVNKTQCLIDIGEVFHFEVTVIEIAYKYVTDSGRT
jgi:hypothetical protein